jgi:glutamate/tyrosine decarboxylase-like PLP-dependent enzyme
MDPHKWFYAPIDAGAILVKDEARLTSSFGMMPSYLTDEMDTDGERYQYYVHGLEQSRRFRSLKVWLGFKRYGTDQIGQWIDANIEQTEHLYELGQESPDFQALIKPLMSGICLRFDPGGVDEETLATVHRTVARRAEAGGRFWFSTTVLKGRSAFRINPINIRTQKGHMDELFTLLQQECARALAEQRKSG